ncbi:MAG: topoisomerase DNA-binding C4 zinc finger domain-containing protein, partial [Parachlamydiaceae bacterium]
EASRVKEREKCGVGRTSTYTAIMNKIQSRDYTIKESGRLKPTELGQVIALLMENNFPQIMNIGFTAAMEDDLELVSENQKDWKSLLKTFWDQFVPTLAIAEKEGFVPKVPTDIDCPECGSKLQKIWFKSKYFYGCSRYPECSFSAPIEQINFNKDEYAVDFNWEQPCPLCQLPMKIRHGRFGAFLGCTSYPTCKGIINIPKRGEVILDAQDMPPCPAIDCTGHMVGRKSRFGKTFYSCSSFPECDVIVNDLAQLEEKYPNHPRTAYVKQPKKGRGRSKAEAAEPKTKAAAGETKTASKTKTKAKTKAKAKEKSATPRKSGFTAELNLSPELTTFLGVDKMGRGDVLKKVWEYIRAHNLQDPANKRRILTDATLAKVFGASDPIDMFKMTGLLSKHMHGKDKE